MLSRYVQLSSVIPKIQVKGIVDLIPTLREDLVIKRMVEDMRELDSVTKALQRESLTLSDVRLLFDAILEKYPKEGSRLKSDAATVQNLDFESGIIKILNQIADKMTPLEFDATLELKMESHSDSENQVDEKCTSLSFADEVLKKQKIRKLESKYLDPRFLLPTTNVVERFFSKAGFTLDFRRGRISPETLEQQLFLHMNSSL